jgi:hypothetical protein
LDVNDLPLFEAVLRDSDRVLAHAPWHVHIGARERLERLATSGAGYPAVRHGSRQPSATIDDRVGMMLLQGLVTSTTSEANQSPLEDGG